MNHIIITGRLTRDPRLGVTSSGTEVCNFTVAVDRFAKKGEDRKVDFIDCVAWARGGAFVHTYFHKGDGITVQGRLESDKWSDEDGNNRTSWHVVCDRTEFPLGRSSNSAQTEESVDNSAQTEESVDSGSDDNLQEIQEDDGDLPF